MADELGMDPRLKRQPRFVSRMLNGIKDFFSRRPGESEERGEYNSSSNALTGPFPWDVIGERKEQWDDIEAMDDDDGVIARCLDIIAERATIGEDDLHAYWFEASKSAPPREGSDDEGDSDIRYEAAANAARVLNEMLIRTRLNDAERCFDDVRAMTKQGNWFWEMTFGDRSKGSRVRLFDSGAANGNGRPYVARVKPFPRSYQIQCNVDAIAEQRSGTPGNCKAGEAAWEQYSDSGDLLAQWSPYEIVHCAFGARQGLVYATPILQPLRRHWRRLRTKEDSLAIARIVRAYPRLKHQILVPLTATPDQVQKHFELYKQNITTRKDMSADITSGAITTSMHQSPVDVETDFYNTAYYTDDGTVISGGVDEIGGNAPHLSDLTDIYWDMARILSRIGVPVKYLNIYLESAKPFVDADQESVDEAFTRMVMRLQTGYKRAVWQVAVMELLLNGINPMDVADHLTMGMAPVSLIGSHIEARILNLRAQTAIMWQTMGFPEDVIGSEILELTGMQVDKWNQERAEMQTKEDKVANEERKAINETYVQPERNSDPSQTPTR